MVPSRSLSTKTIPIKQKSNRLLRHPDEKIACLLMISLFIPGYYPFCLCFPAALGATVYILTNKNRRAALFPYRHNLLLPVLWVMLIVFPLINQNYPGVLCGFLFDIYLFDALWLGKIMTVPLVERLCDIACAASIVCAADAIAQYYLVKHEREASFFWNANFYAFVIELVVILSFYRFYTARRNRWLYIAVVAVNIAALILTGCRSAWIAMFLGLLCLFAMTKKWRAVIVLTLCAALCAVLLCLFPQIFPRVYQMQMASLTRFRIWRGAFEDFLRHPLTGQGLLAYYHVSHDFITPHAHSILFDMLECVGLIGTSITVIYIVSVIKQLGRKFKSALPEQKACIALAAGLAVSVFIHGITDIPYMGVQTGLFLIMLFTFRQAALNECEKQ